MTTTEIGTGVPADGKAYFEQKCSSCHSVGTDSASISEKYGSASLKTQILSPAFLEKTTQSWELSRLHDTKDATSRAQHRKLLENYAAQEAANVVSYFQALK